MSGAIADEVKARLTDLRQELENHDGDRPHDHVARIAVTEAIDAGLEGNAAVGALLTGPDGEIIASERNRMFVPYFRSDFHAEMVLLTAFEDENRPVADLREHTLVTSLEPCEMCNIRIINSGVSHVLWVSADLGKGAINGPNQLADHWARLAEPQHFGAADCDSRLAEISLEAFEATIGGVSEHLMDRRLPPEGD
ncbi:MAG: nucleoside deaminase [Acidimicrobiia bacterium]|nr:nucleoside deaminase [Acidimicrobiia bacterium]